MARNDDAPGAGGATGREHDDRTAARLAQRPSGEVRDVDRSVLDLIEHALDRAVVAWGREHKVCDTLASAAAETAQELKRRGSA